MALQLVIPKPREGGGLRVLRETDMPRHAERPGDEHLVIGRFMSQLDSLDAIDLNRRIHQPLSWCLSVLERIERSGLTRQLYAGRWCLTREGQAYWWHHYAGRAFGERAAKEKREW